MAAPDVHPTKKYLQKKLKKAEACFKYLEAGGTGNAGEANALNSNEKYTVINELIRKYQ
ncbi:hypothetical protein QUF84_04150 [Fictibacillus enclensis]|uniref:hypothetical protein n=1 Tax=Fictibacillus enclensis TaxID=1017270 RepID=UPI0025A0A01F|nr:hypothetical protein [Fictibacillus enclensis]MDM5336421.1 hypothetical protein [Fictibacillus enclensis]